MAAGEKYRNAPTVASGIGPRNAIVDVSLAAKTAPVSTSATTIAPTVLGGERPYDAMNARAWAASAGF